MSNELEQILALVAAGQLSPEDAEPLVAAITEPPADPLADTRPWPATPPPPPIAPPAPPAPGTTGGATRAVRIQVTDGGRNVVNLRVPMSLASLAGSVIPGLAEPQVARLQQALRDGEVGTILDVRDDQGSGVVIATE